MAEIRIIADEIEGRALIDALAHVIGGWRVTGVRGPRRSRRDSDKRLWYIDVERLPAGDAADANLLG